MMIVLEANASVILTHRDICRLFGLEDDDMPTSNGYKPGRLGNNGGTQATLSLVTPVWGREDERQSELTQLTATYVNDSLVDQTSSDVDNYTMTLLETAVIAQDIMTFQTLANAITWSEKAPADLVKAVRLALDLEAPLIARKLAEQGVKYHPAHQEIKKMARILATPTVTPASPSSMPDIKANQAWIKAHREAYRRQWVALLNGELIAASQTFSDLLAKVGDVKGKGILVTQVT